MKLENQVCSLELAKKLKALNVKQESAFYWSQIHGSTSLVQKETLLARVADEEWTYLDEGLHRGHVCSAFTVAELGEMLPLLCETVRTRESSWRIEYQTPATTKEGRPYWERMYFKADTEADARAKMLIYLLENKLRQQIQLHEQAHARHTDAINRSVEMEIEIANLKDKRDIANTEIAILHQQVGKQSAAFIKLEAELQAHREREKALFNSLNRLWEVSVYNTEPNERQDVINEAGLLVAAHKEAGK